MRSKNWVFRFERETRVDFVWNLDTTVSLVLLSVWSSLIWISNDKRRNEPMYWVALGGMLGQCTLSDTAITGMVLSPRSTSGFCTCSILLWTSATSSITPEKDSFGHCCLGSPHFVFGQRHRWNFSELTGRAIVSEPQWFIRYPWDSKCVAILVARLNLHFQNCHQTWAHLPLIRECFNFSRTFKDHSYIVTLNNFQS